MIPESSKKDTSSSSNVSQLSEQLKQSTALQSNNGTLVASAQSFEPYKRDSSGKSRDFISKGERVHNEITYRGVDWLVNSAFGIAFAFVTHRTKLGRDYFAKPVEHFFTKVLSPFIKNKQNLAHSAEWGGTFVSIMFGGTVTIPPLMYLENPKHKIPIVKKLDEWIYGKEAVEKDEKFAKAYQEIEHQPKKDFSTGMYSRLLALAPLLAMTVHKPTNAFIKKNFYDYISKASKYVSEAIGFGEKGYWAKMDHHGNDNTPISHWNYLHRTLAFDVGLTVLYSFLHEGTYKLFARKKDDRKHHRMENDNNHDGITRNPFLEGA